ncbi:MAG: anaerobic ribonucleoside-triphosphate reductase activating protein [Lachnospiraceae bacterium]|nr:anaerobic ribonucleoside-triphosphate reductase activating protein [Lachnospiraceae bacterium]
MLILGLSKTTLLDYPGHVAASLFTGGCNFRCPYCHNRDIVLKTKALMPLTDEEIFSFLNKRRNVLSGVCITGGEPTLHSELPDFIGRIKRLGYLVKLDTNGTNPNMLQSLISDGLIDYCAMDIKNAPQKYAVTAGFPDMAESFRLSSVDQSIHTLLNQQRIDYEFRTTVVKELHDEDDMISISKWISGAKAYFLQSYVDNTGVLCPGCHAHSEEKLRTFADLCRPLVPSVALRGI